MQFKIKKTIGHGVLYTILIVFSIITLYPVVYAILGSFKTNMELMTGGGILPSAFQFKNYLYVWEKANFAKYTMNSVFICFFSTIGALIISSITAYCIERYDFFGKKVIYALYLSTMFIALGAVTLRPLYLLAVQADMHNTLWPIIIIQIGSQGVNIFLITKFIKSIPKELDEAAMIDGCGPFKIYYAILVPLLKPILAVVALFQFRLSWNDYIVPSVFTMTQPDLRPLTVGVVQLKWGTGAASEWHLMMTGAAISIIPILIIYFVANKHFMAGLTDGGVKG